VTPMQSLLEAERSGLKREITEFVARYGVGACALLREASGGAPSNDPGRVRAMHIVGQLDEASAALLPALINAYFNRQTIDIRV
jgi:hypothetical protein